MKRFVFRAFPLLAVLGLVAGILIFFGLKLPDRVTLTGALIAGVLGFCYFIQQQRLAETHLFKELFTEFNQRYDQMNDELTSIATAYAATLEQKQRIVDYLNLCAEEYLFYREGYILPHVWQAWCRGMLQYVDNESFRTVWQSELESGSFYGLSEARIRDGAA